MARRDIVGSWFPSGFHGHFRCKSRPDFSCEYRHLAKPAPPCNFMNRMHEESYKHPFSHHDNKNMFPTDAMYLGKVGGLRKLASRDANLNFLSWQPVAEELRKAPPQISLYKVDYRIKENVEPHRQKFVRRPQTSFDCGRPLTTTYRYAHSADNPNQAMLNALSNVNLKVAPPHKCDTSKDSVATCMSWYWPHPPRRERQVPSNQEPPPYDTDIPPTPPSTAPPPPPPPPISNVFAT